MNNTIEKYFSGETTKDEEQILLQYFLSENVDPELKEYQTYFQGLAQLKHHAKVIIPEDDYENVKAENNITYYIKRFGIPIAVAASIALFLLFFPFLHINNNYVVINGKKYTDKKHIELAMHTSLNNVKLDVQQMFDELDTDLFN